jgi:hypothetical protein
LDPRSFDTTYQARHSPSSNSSRFFHIRFNQPPTLTFTSSLGRGTSPQLIRTAQLLLQSLLSRPLSAAAVGDPAPHRLTSPTDDTFQCCFLDSTGTEKPHNLVNRSKRRCCNLGWAWTIDLQLPLAYTYLCVQSCAAGKQVGFGVCTRVSPQCAGNRIVVKVAQPSHSATATTKRLHNCRQNSASARRPYETRRTAMNATAQ